MRPLLWILPFILLPACMGAPQTPPAGEKTASETTIQIEDLTPIEEEEMEQPADRIIEPEQLAGTWEGRLEVGAIQLRVVFHINLEQDGSLSAVMDSPDQGAFGIPTSGTSLEGDTLVIEAAAVAGKYEGKAQEEGSLLGTWFQGGQELPLKLEKREQPIDYSRPQDPVKPYPYHSEDITFRNQEAGITLAGTLSYPKTGEPFTTVILISGSGSQDRNEELMGHRPFLVLADHLTRQGIAVLRYDDRGIGGSGGDPSTSTSQDYLTDVEAAIRYLMTQPLFAVKQIGLIGHSEGGMIAPMVAAGSKAVAFIILMAGPGCPGDQILIQQTEAIMRAKGLNDQQIRQIVSTNRALYDIAMDTEDYDEAASKIKAILSANGLNEQQIKDQTATLLNPWFVFFMKHDPVPVLKQVQVPVLAINGSLDLQVLPGENLGAIKDALIAGGSTRYTIQEFPGLNHLFQTAETGLMEEYNSIEETIAPQVLEYISSWINNGLKLN